MEQTEKVIDPGNEVKPHYTLREVLDTHAQGLRSSPSAPSVRREAVLIAEIEAQRKVIAQQNMILLDANYNGLNELRDLVHEANAKWWISLEDGVTPLKRNKGELLALIHSEISEALEGERKDLMDDKLPHRKMAEVELADALIRILDYCGGFNYDLAGAFEEKMAYNRTREDHTHEARKIANGKQF